MWLIPTRNRPQAMSQVIAAMRETGDVPEAAVMIDGDPALYSDVAWPDHWHIHSSPEHLEMQRALNELLRLHPGERTYGFIGDHVLPKTANWAKELEASAGLWNIAFCNDKNPRVNRITGFVRLTSMCVGGELVRACGFMWPPFLVHLGGDDIWEDIGWELGLMRQRKDVVIEETFVGAYKRDGNSKRMYQGQNYAESDLRAVIDWRRDRKAGFLAELSNVIPAGYREDGLIPRQRQHVTVCCVQAGDYCGMGARYVNTLFDMVRRNLESGFPGTFVCFTDNPEGLHEDIVTRPLPVEGLDGWWNKLAMFKPGVFPEGDRIVFIDLDTLIVGKLEDIFDCTSDFAMLSDFYRPESGASGVMLWKAGVADSIWTAWDMAGRPLVPGGDGAWIDNYMPNAERLQDLFPGRFVSFKAHCKPFPPSGSSVVCFHGLPRPHDCTGWVDKIWSIGGGTATELVDAVNSDRDSIVSNIQFACLRELPWLAMQPEHDSEVVIVGGGPSLAESLDEIRSKSESCVIAALNGSADYLHDNGIRVDWQVVLDARPENVRFVTKRVAGKYWISSQCHPSVFDAVKGKETVVFHPHINDIEKYLIGIGEVTLVGGGSTVGLLALSIAHTQGFRRIHLYGYDSSYRDDIHHAYAQTENDHENCVEAFVGSRRFTTAAWMVRQVQDFQATSAYLAELGCEIHVHGDGLLPHTAWLMMNMNQLEIA